MAFVGSTIALGSKTQSSNVCKANSFVGQAIVRAPETRKAPTWTMKTEAWVQMLPTADLEPGKLYPVEVSGLTLVIACDDDGQVYCSANICPHLGTPLDNGTVADGNIICAQHKSSWSMTTGELAGDWCPFPPVLGPLLGKLRPPTNLDVYSVRENAGFIEALIDVDSKDDYEKNYWRGLLDSTGKATGEYY
mmetsp:Transcript_18396/g.38501  ORF Transcript_18396/g.38501 Transcript_18396/m.38501 type:complete len:192 (-) Transcript_18396:1229-1804(-)|eukprot:CAMPEP_0184688562 /NCGR_PEP_ID=MMETSP0312-20130426/30167_1 /TAXON_ID=31354 /ORGANISM="Compsopogon coeruleus, Strain SAG 36.94" /LENGTH=191 /DNA_ID=CAMNT_0027145813 /DNA_START=72 /DNA_END=647 /DNA_ORIENTATION=+